MQNHPRIVALGKRIYAFLSWSLLLLAILSWMFVPETRKGLFQLLLCLYALWQFWILSRSKTLSWAEFIRVFTVGAWVIGPLTAGVVWGTHALLDERPDGTIRDEWSTVYFGPFVEEVCKLIPLGFLCLFSRRSRSYGICDYMLIGAASGTGFEFIEEMVRRWTADVHLSIDTLINRAFGDEYEWRWDLLFPGAYEYGNQFAPGHHVWTGFIALGIGFAVSLQAKWGRKAYVIPLFLFCWALFDHSSFNDNDLHWTVGIIYDLLGNGHFYRYFFIVCIVVAVCRDYWLLNKQRQNLPLLHREVVIDPVSELLLLLQSLWKGAGAFFHTLAFLRERRQLGYALCRVVDEKHVNDLTKWIVPRFSFLASVFVCIAIFLIGVEQVSLFMGIGDQAYFAGLLKDLSAWWNDLSTLEKGAMIVTTVVLGGLLTVLTGGGFLAGSIGALGAALTIKDILDNPDPIVHFIENPKASFEEWKKQFFTLTPSEATGLAAAITISFLLDRLPAKRIMDLVLDNLREGVQHLTRKLFPPMLQIEMGGGKWNIPRNWMPDNYWQSSTHGGSGGKGHEGTPKVNPLKVSNEALDHANLGDFTRNPKTGEISKMSGGGHGQDNIAFLEKNGIEYNIELTYPNGVRVGNVPGHKSKGKRTGTGQAWFPETWTKEDISKAGEYVANMPNHVNVADGVTIFGEYKGVRVGVIKTNGEIGTIFPDNMMQP